MTSNAAFVAASPLLSTRSSFAPSSFVSATCRPQARVRRVRTAPPVPCASLFGTDADSSARREQLLRDVEERVRAGAALAGKGLAVLAVSAALTLLPFGDNGAEAARSGGRVGGSQFRSAPARVAPSPSPSYGGGYGGGYGYGYGYGAPSLFMNPFILPFGGFGVGIGSLGSFLILAAVASLLANTLRTASDAAETMESTKTGLVLLKVGLLSSARGVQVELDNMTRAADTSTIQGLAYVVQTSATALLRHPDYWVYGSASTTTSMSGESDFNQLALQQRLKLDEETLSNTAGIKYESEKASAQTADLGQSPKEYIVVTFVVAADGRLVTQTPKNVDSTTDVDRALQALASLSADRLQAVEIIWAPQSYRDSLTEREMLEDHPELKRL